MKIFSSAPFLVPIANDIYEIVGTPYSVDVMSGSGRFRYYKVTAYHSSYKEEVKVTLEEFFDAAPVELKEFILFNLDLFRDKKWKTTERQN